MHWQDLAGPLDPYRGGRGSRRKEKEPVFPDHGSGVILQPDRLLQACLHPFLSRMLAPSLILSIPVFLSVFIPSPFPDVPAVIRAPFTAAV